MKVKPISEKQEIILLSVDEIKFDRSIYPRFDPSEEDIERLTDLLKSGEVKPEDFPPVVIDQQYRLLDGYHRWQAHKKAGLETIRVKVRQVTDDYEALRMACQLNAIQGVQLTKWERMENGIKLYRMACKGFNLPSKKEVGKIAKAVGVSRPTLYRWTEEFRESLKEERNEKIKQLREEGKTQEEVAEILNISQQTVSYVENTFTNSSQMRQTGKTNTEIPENNPTNPYWTEKHQRAIEYLHEPMPSEEEEEPEYKILTEEEYERYKREEEEARKQREVQIPFDLNTRRGVHDFMRYVVEHADEILPSAGDEEKARERYLKRRAEREKYGVARVHFEEFQRRNRRYVMKISGGIKWFEQLARCGIGMLGVLKDRFQKTEDPAVKEEIRKMRAEVRGIIDQAINEVEKTLQKFKGMYQMVLLDEEREKDPLQEMVKEIVGRAMIKAIEKSFKE